MYANLRTLFAAALMLCSALAAHAVTYIDRSGTITTGGTSQTLAAANPTRGRIAVTNHPTETEVLCVNVTSAASCTTPGSWVLAPGETIVIDSNEAVTVVATTTGHKYTAKENITEGFSINVSGSTSISGGAGDASAANQVTGNNTLSAINTKVPSLGQAVAASSMPVVLPVLQNAVNTQGSTTSGQSGALIQGAVTTSAPTYTNAQTSPLSLDTSGNLRVAVSGGGSAVTGGSAHDAAGAAVNPVAIGGFASAAAPTDVSADTDIVRSWHLRNGALAVQQTFAGALAVGGAGAASSGTMRVVAASDAPDVAALGAVADAAATQGSTGSISAKLRTVTSQLNSIDAGVPAALGATTMSAAMPVTIATDDARIGIVTETAPASDTASSGLNGRLQRIAQNLTTLNTSINTASNYEATKDAAVPSRLVAMGARIGANEDAVAQGAATAAINVSTATTTQLVALSGTTKIYVTGLVVVAGGTGNITLVYGTGSNCGTGTTSLSGAIPLTAQAGFSIGSGLGAVLMVPAGQALCVTTSAAVQMSGFVTYAQY